MSDEIIINIQEDIENIVVSPQEDIENIVVSLASLSVITVNGQVGNVIIDLSKYESVYSNVNSNSANNASVYSNVNSLSSDWNSVYSNVNMLSSKWEINSLDGGSSLSVYLGYQVIDGGLSNSF